MSYERERLAFPPITPAVKHLLIANAVVFVVNALMLGRLSVPVGDSGGFWFAFSWEAMLEGYGLGILRLLTYQFTHSFGDAWHFLFNMISLYVFGTMAERKLGYRGIFKVYVLGGIAGAVLHLVIAATQGQVNVPLVGASGACYALMLYAATMSPNAQIIFFIVRIPIWLLAAVLVGLGLYSTYIELFTGGMSRVSHGAHLGGALLGHLAFRFGWFVDYRPYGEGPGLVAGLRDRWRVKKEASRARASAEKEQVLDEILAKVKEHGLGSLTPQERKFLERKSEESRRDS